MDAQKRVGPLGLRLGQRAERTKMVTDADLHVYAGLTGDRNPLHFDDAFAQATRCGRLISLRRDGSVRAYHRYRWELAP